MMVKALLYQKLDPNKCPICKKLFSHSWMVVNHIRMKNDPLHGEWGEFPKRPIIEKYLKQIGYDKGHKKLDL